MNEGVTEEYAPEDSRPSFEIRVPGAHASTFSGGGFFATVLQNLYYRFLLRRLPYAALCGGVKAGETVEPGDGYLHLGQP